MVELWTLARHFLPDALTVYSAMTLAITIGSISLGAALLHVARKMDLELRMAMKQIGVSGVSRDVSRVSIFCPADRYLSVIYPAFEEEQRLPRTLEGSIQYLEQRVQQQKGFSYEVIIVDDGSRDGTPSVAAEAVERYGPEKVRLICLPRNQGKGAAVRKGVMSSRGALVLFADADGATAVQEVEKLERRLLSLLRPSPSDQPQVEAEVDMRVASLKGSAFGSRAHLQTEAVVKRVWYRNVLMYGFHFCVMMVAGGSVQDTQCGFKLFTREAAGELFSHLRLNRWCFDVELLLLCLKMRIPVVEVPVQWLEMKGSKIRPTSILHMILELAIVKFAYALGLWTIRN